MSIIRTNFNLLVDDDGTNLVGTVWDKAHIKDVILDPIDAEITRLDAADALKLPLAGGTLSGNLGIRVAPSAAYAIQLHGTTTTNAAGIVRGEDSAGGTIFYILNNGEVYCSGAVRFGSYTATTFAAGDKYLVIDASGNIHRSAIGPAS